MKHRKSRTLLAMIAMSCMIIHTHVAITAPLIQHKIERYGTIGVVGYDYPPLIDTNITNISKGEAYAKSMLGGAAGGGVGGLAFGIDALDSGSCSGDAGICAGAAVVMLSVFVAVGIVAGLASGIIEGSKNEADSPELAKASQETINRKVINSVATLQTTLRDRVADYASQQTGSSVKILPEESLKPIEPLPERIETAEQVNNISDYIKRMNKEKSESNKKKEEEAGLPNYKHLKSQGIDTVLEIGYTDIKEYNKAILLTAQVRFYNTQDNALIHKESFIFRSMSRLPSQWAINDAESIVNVLNTASRQFAQRIVHEFLLVMDAPPAPVKNITLGNTLSSTTFSDEEQQAEPVARNYIELLSIYPPAEFCLFCKNQIETVLVNSLKPIIKWETLDEALRRNSYLKSGLNEIDDVVYDIEIYPAFYFQDSQAPPLMSSKTLYETAYAGYGLDTPLFQPDTALHECSGYYWTYRARFKKDNYWMATEWGNHPGLKPDIPAFRKRYYDNPDCSLCIFVAPLRFLNYFETPCKPKKQHKQESFPL